MLMIFLLVIFIGGLSWFLWIVLSPLWYGQKRWVVWYSPKLVTTTGYFSAEFTVPLTYYAAKDYAEIFNGTVYRVR